MQARILLITLLGAGCGERTAVPSTPARRAPVAGPKRCALPSLPHAAIENVFRRHGVTGTLLLKAGDGRTLVHHHPDRAKKRYLPASTFKIPHALIALQTGVIGDDREVIPWDDVPRAIEAWNRDHTLASAMKYSVVWAFQVIARRIGSRRMRAWIKRLGYGNQKISGGLDSFWLQGGLRISAQEQIRFLRRLERGALPVSPRSVKIVRRILVREQTPAYTLRAKTGSAKRPGKWLGWYVGWIETRACTAFFALNIDLQKRTQLRARQGITREILKRLGLLPAGAAQSRPVFSRPPPYHVSIGWRRLQNGLEYARIDLPEKNAVGDNRLHVVRVDPEKAHLAVGLASTLDRKKRTARKWCRKSRLAVAINLGMFKTDHLTHVGYLRVGRHEQNKKWRKDYFSAVAFDPKKPGLPRAVMVDLYDPGARERLQHYRVVAQNLRLIKHVGGRGENVWRNKPKRWSEAALAQDSHGRLLFLFCRSPFRMARLNRILLRLPLDIIRAQHLEGGPEASLSIHVGGLNLDLAGSFETRYAEHDKNRAQWRLPLVLGVRR